MYNRGFFSFRNNFHPAVKNSRNVLRILSFIHVFTNPVNTNFMLMYQHFSNQELSNPLADPCEHRSHQHPGLPNVKGQRVFPHEVLDQTWIQSTCSTCATHTSNILQYVITSVTFSNCYHSLNKTYLINQKAGNSCLWKLLSGHHSYNRNISIFSHWKNKSHFLLKVQIEIIWGAFLTFSKIGT